MIKFSWVEKDCRRMKKYFLDINLEDMETTSGEIQEYWILAIQAAREARILRDSEGNASTNGKTT